MIEKVCGADAHSRLRKQAALMRTNCCLPDHALARERPKASPVQGEVAKIFDFCRRGCQASVNPPVSSAANRLRAVRSRL